jgi:hypothetical protein
MLTQWGDGLCGCGFDTGPVGLAYGAPEGDRTEAFGGAEAMLAALRPSEPLIKTQTTGPVTLSLGMLAAGHPGEGLFDCLLEGLRRRVEAHLGAIGEVLPDARVVLVYDEPGLTGLGTTGFPIKASETRRLLEQTLRNSPIPAGIHCCGPTDWSLVAAVDPVWISWDVDALGAAFEETAEEVAAAVARGTRIMWGVVPTDPGPPPRDLLGRFQHVVGTLVMAGADMNALTEEALFTPACGLANLTVEQAEIVANTVTYVVGELNEVWA